MEQNVKTTEEAIRNFKQALDLNSNALDAFKLELQELRFSIGSLENKLATTLACSDTQGETTNSLSNHLKTHDEQLGLIDRNLELHLQYIAMLNEKIPK